MNLKYKLTIISTIVILFTILTSTQVYSFSNNISGTIKDSSNNPVITKIELVHGTNNYNTISSRVDGSFALSIPTGSYTLKFTSINQTTNMPRFFMVEKHVSISSNTVQNIVPSIATISVNIKDSSNSPIQNAILDSGVGKITLGGFTGTEEDMSTTDTNGNVILHLLPATFSNVKIIMPDDNTYIPNSGRTITISGSASYNISIPSNPTVSGTIKDSSNNPVRTTIELIANDYVERTQTDPSGSYSFSVPQGTYTIKFSQLFTNQTNMPMYFDAEKQITISSSSTQNLVAPVITVSGQINQTSIPIKVRQNLDVGGFSGFSLDSVITDSAGHFTAKLLQSTDNHITIQINGTGRFFQCTLNSSTISC